MSLLSLGGHSDLPLRDDATSRFLPWLVAPMVFLCAVALAGVFILNTLIGRWDRDVSGTLTVEIAAAPGDAAESTAVTKQRTEQAVALLSATPGIAQARALSQEQLAALLAPWLGNSDLLKELPLPAMIDVTVRPEARPDLNELSQRLSKAVPGASIDDHRAWLSRLIGISRSIEWLAVAVVILIGGVTSATVIYATRTGMAVHHEVIEVLHLIGATDDYVARQFASRAFSLGLKGGLFGLGLIVPMTAALVYSTRQMEGGFLADLSLPLTGWIAVLLLPLAAALLAMLTARLTVHASLARMV
ncbi:MAG TPA: FtsX-like permease family protein [Candidatus Sulfotelmatobacter sp.]|jgi:cell division transport system permease protein|nr:FtsX-like permease family protein [Candidatus Sulfotelmatobacter sp.]